MSAAKVSLVSNGLFVVLLAALHGLKSDLDPSWHFISEYGIGKLGWVLQVAFNSLAVSNVAILVAIRQCLLSVAGRVAAVLYLLGTVGLVLAAIFVTDPINAPVDSRTLSGNLHNLGGALGLLSFIATVIFSVRLFRCTDWRTSRLAVAVALTVLILGFLISFFGIMGIVAQNQGEFGPDAPVGWPNRIGILAGCFWLAVIAWQADRNAHLTRAVESRRGGL